VGLVQLNQVQRACTRRPYASFIMFGVAAVIVLFVVLFPQLVAGMLADWWP